MRLTATSVTHDDVKKKKEKRGERRDAGGR